MTKSFLTACLATLFLSLAVPGPAAAAPAGPDPAVTTVRAFYDALLDSMKHAKALGIKGRYKKLEPAVDAAFDFPVMTRLAVGPQWQSMSDADHKTLTAAFQRMTIADYAHNFDGYNGEDFVVDPQVRERAGDKIVSSKMVVKGQDPIPFVYRMRNSGNGWKIIDIFLNGYVSEVATKRADFASTLKSGGATALAQKLNAMSDRELAGK